tara:strand:- start:143 stop:1117 length:975 start_codon:yes stop_codon:yes gene_type:complete
MNKVIAITIGDIKGIGIDVLLKSWLNNQLKNFILFTDHDKLLKYFKRNKIKISLNIIDLNKKNFNFNINKFNVFSYKSKTDEENTYKSLKLAYDFCIKNYCIGIITLPLRKDKIIKSIDKRFIGHTEFYQKLDNKKQSNMVLFHKKIIVSPLTTHIEINKISEFIKDKTFIYNQLVNLNETLRIDFNIEKPKIILSGLNPHAGENGKIGKEEIKYLIPVVNKLKIKGINIEGPFSADSLLIRKNMKKYDCFVFIYHDQALIPFKFISQFTGVNYTGNLEIIRTSPDHGTAYDLIGSKNISNTSFLNCYKLINTIYKNRIINDKS